jgi:hypothetical protein
MPSSCDSNAVAAGGVQKLGCPSFLGYKAHESLKFLLMGTSPHVSTEHQWSLSLGYATALV